MGSTWRTIEMLRLGLVISHLMGGVLSLTPPVVEIGNGKLQGTYYRTFNDRDVLAFLGVPFAEPPVGNMRFRPPLPVRGWEGMRVANDTRAPCLQYNHYLSAIGRKPIIGQEDCLYLDVYTPRLQTDRLMEVVVFVHGGAFTYGSRSGFNPKYLLAEKELVLVVISYRVGPFGFLSTGDEVVPGNMGMKDQTEALRWVNRNIDKFGGDPDKVTLAGLSAGGASVHFHYFSPESRRYFKQGISLSGTALCPWALMESPEQKTTILANAVGCPTNTTSLDTIDCLRDRPGELILYRMHSTLMPWLFNPISPFAPTIENTPSQRPFLVDHPEKLLREGKVYDAPWLVGFTSGEGFYPASEFVLDERLMSDLNNNWTIIAPHLLDFNFTEPDSNLRTAKSIKIKDHYLKGSHFLTRDSTLDVIEMVSDRMYLSAIDKAVRLQAKVNRSPVYVYNFAYRGRNTLWEQFAGMKTDMGAGHGDDVAYVLGAYFSCTDSDDDRKMVDTMVGVWSSYAKNSQPASVAGETWTPQVGDKNVTYLLIESSERASMESSNHLGNTHFWDTLLSAELASSTRHDEF